jgi:hypothetical protein
MKIIRAISSLILAVLVLITSTSFMVGIHVCRGHIKEIALMKKAKPCAMEQLAEELGFSKDNCHAAPMKGCCEDRTINFKGNDYKYKATQQIILPSNTTVPTQAPVLISVVLPIQPIRSYGFQSYRPPSMSRDVTILVQSFLI